MHALPWPEGGLNLTVCHEAKCVIEEESVRVRRHSNALKTALRSERGGVLYEVAANSLPHPIRINEQVLEFKDAVNRDSGGETHDVITVGSDSGKPFGDAVPFQHQRLWVGEESVAVTFIGQRRPGEHIRQSRPVGRSAPTNTKQRHCSIVTCSTHPSQPYPEGTRDEQLPPSPTTKKRGQPVKDGRRCSCGWRRNRTSNPRARATEDTLTRSDSRPAPERAVAGKVSTRRVGESTLATVEGLSGSFRPIIVAWPLKSKPRSTSNARERS